MGVLKRSAKAPFAIWTFILSLTVEPIAFLNYLSSNLLHVIHPTGLYQVVCYQAVHLENLYNLNVTNTIDCKQLKNYSSLEILVQVRVSEINMYLALVHMIPAMVAHVFLGAWSDKHGRKINILIGTVGIIINTLPFVIVFVYQLTPLWILIVVGAIAGATGYKGIVMLASFAYLADINVKKENVTIRMVIYAVIMSLSGVIGSLLAAVFLRLISLSYACVIQMAILAVSFFFALVRLKQIPPAIMKQMSVEKTIKKNGLEKVDFSVSSNPRTACVVKSTSSDDGELVTTNRRTKGQMVKQFFLDSWILLRSVWTTYAKPRPRRKRLYLCIVAAMFFVHYMSNMSHEVNSLYVFRSPISWTGEQLAYWKAATHVLNFAGNLLGVLVLKKLLKLRETTIILIALCSHISQEVIMSFASRSWMLYLATCTGSLSLLFMPTLKSLVTQMVDADEVGKAFVLFGLAHDVGEAISHVSANAIYKSTVAYFPGFIYLLCTGVVIVTLAVFLFVHFDSMRQEKRHMVANSITLPEISN